MKRVEIVLRRQKQKHSCCLRVETVLRQNKENKCVETVLRRQNKKHICCHPNWHLISHHFRSFSVSVLMFVRHALWIVFWLPFRPESVEIQIFRWLDEAKVQYIVMFCEGLLFSINKLPDTI